MHYIKQVRAVRDQVTTQVSQVSTTLLATWPKCWLLFSTIWTWSLLTSQLAFCCSTCERSEGGKSYAFVGWLKSDGPSLKLHVRRPITFWLLVRRPMRHPELNSALRLYPFHLRQLAVPMSPLVPCIIWEASCNFLLQSLFFCCCWISSSIVFSRHSKGRSLL